MTLFEKQVAFAQTIAKFLNRLDELGYQVTLGEAYRPKEIAQMYADQARGIANSLHCLRLAFDLNLFKDKKYLTKTEEYLEAGELWESYSNDDIQCCWGGRFNDGNHFSIEHNGTK